MKKILIIDDDEDFLEWITMGLIRDGYSIFSSLSGNEGLELFKKESPEIVIVDIALPDIDGFEICRKIRQSKLSDSTGIILVTGVFKEIEAKEKGYNAGADDFLVKPFSYEVLRIRVLKQIKQLGNVGSLPE